jgi:branched-chain amino acid transport system permease protein
VEWWEVLVQQTINGLTRGAVFALIALGYTMVYGIIELINFAHGDVFMLGLFISLAWFSLFGISSTLGLWQLVTLLPLVFVLTMLSTAVINVSIDRVAYRPLRRSTRLAPLITAIGVSFMLENLALLWKGPAPIAYPDVFPSVDILREWFGVDSAIFITTKDILVVGATIPLMIALNYFVTRTRWGKAMRATAQDRETAQAMGIDVERTILVTFLVGGALAGAAGLIQGLYYNIGMWWMGYQAGLRAFTAAVLGGIGNMPGAALGGLVIGFLSAWSDQYISARWTNAIVFSILILVLVFRPQGLLGDRTPEKV